VPFTSRGTPPRSLTAENLIGYVPGRRDPNRFLVISAHYDHLGTRDGQVYNGADDNASGVSALLALAEDFARNRPEHSVLLVAFDAEEHGHKGSLGFVAAPPVPKSAMVLNMNLDMVGRGDRGELYVSGGHPYPVLRPHLEALAREAPVTLKLGHDTPDLPKEQNWITQSDHFAFHQAGIPFAYFGVEDHPDYHQPGDDAEKIPEDFYRRAVRTLAMAARRFDRELGAIARARAEAPKS
jgi:Zn-dependent M28 family amino/carboxypeptidase